MTPSLPPAYRLIALDRVGSTNDEAKRLAGEGAEEGTLIWAIEQTAGRGRQGRQWASPPGNLYCSLILRPDRPVAEAAQLSFAAALAVGGAVGGVVPPLTDLRYKWPNDVLLNGRKAAGILLESASRPDGALDYLVLGVGVNIASHPSETSFPATSLGAEGGGCEVGELLESFARHFLVWVDRWVDEGFAPLRDAWTKRAWQLGGRLEVGLGNGIAVGKFVELGDDGALVLELDGGSRKRIAAGDVTAARLGGA